MSRQPMPDKAPTPPPPAPLSIVCCHDSDVEVIAVEYYAGKGCPIQPGPFVAIAIQSQITGRQIGIHLTQTALQDLHRHLGECIDQMKGGAQ